VKPENFAPKIVGWQVVGEAGDLASNNEASTESPVMMVAAILDPSVSARQRHPMM
jgi:hypothetical protein